MRPLGFAECLYTGVLINERTVLPMASKRTLAALGVALGGLASTAAAATVASATASPRIPLLPGEDVIWPDGQDRFAVVLGVGGVPGAAWEAATVAHMRGTDLDPWQAGLVVGTSAGSLVAALLRVGLGTEALVDLACRGVTVSGGRILRLPDPRMSAGDARARRSWTQPWNSLRVGRMPRFPAALAGLLPPDGFSLEDLAAAVDSIWEAHHPGSSWPRQATWLCAVDVKYGQRTVFGIPGEPGPTLGAAVAASCAVPGVLSPVEHDGRWYVDGGVASLTSVDLAVAAGAERVLLLNPVTGRTRRGGPKGIAENGVRAFLARESRGLLERARRAGVDVVEWVPGEDETEALGASLLDFDRGPAIVEAVRERFAREANPLLF